MESGKRIASALTEIPYHLLEEIFLLLPAIEDLARVSAACVAFRRLATDGSFLRRFRRLHAPPLIGFLDDDGFHPAVPPHPSAPAARALSLAADFTFSFLPSYCRWVVRDVRDGRVLLSRKPGKSEFPIFRELVVCDPLHRRYILLPPLPHGLAAPVVQFTFFFEPSLIPLPPSEDDGVAEETAFRVIWFVRCNFELSIFVFSSSAGQWCAPASQDLRDLLLAKGESTMSRLDYVINRHYACGRVYWELTNSRGRNELLALDTRGMEFSILSPPKGWKMRGIEIVEAGDGRLGMFRLFDETAQHDLRYIIGGNTGLCSNQWGVENTISLDSQYRYRIGAAAGRYLLLHRIEAQAYERNSLDRPDMEYFSLDVETLQLERVCGKPMWPGASRTHLYINYPPSLLSAPTV